jgi:WD40 repeat protein
MPGHRKVVTCVSSGIVADSDRVLVASGSGDRTVRLWNVRTGECVRELSGHSDWVNSVSSRIDIDGRRLLASGSGDGSMRLWDVASGECVGVVSVPGGKVRAVSDGFGVGVGGSDDRVLVATGSEDTVVRVWDVGSVLRSQSRGSDRGVNATCVSNSLVDAVSTGRSGSRCLVASGCRDGSVALWDVDSGECVRKTSGHKKSVCCVSSTFVASGRQLLASGSDDRTVWLWDVGSGDAEVRRQHVGGGAAGHDTVGADGIARRAVRRHRVLDDCELNPRSRSRRYLNVTCVEVTAQRTQTRR